MNEETCDWTKDEEWLAKLDKWQQFVIDGTAKLLTHYFWFTAYSLCAKISQTALKKPNKRDTRMNTKII